MATASVRVGACLLPDVPWRTDRDRWRLGESVGFHGLWTYDHLSWRSLRDGPWYTAVPLLAAAAAETSTVRLGTLVASPNFRHPVTFAKDVVALDEISSGRLDVGIGAGGAGPDATVLGGEQPSPGERVERLAEFLGLFDRLLREPAVTARGERYCAVDARMIPGCVQQPRVPLTVAASGPRALRVAARFAQCWVTYGPLEGGDDRAGWFAGVRAQVSALETACLEESREPTDLGRMALIGLETAWAQASAQAWDDTVGELGDLGFTDVVVHWPRPDDPSLPGPPPAVFDHIVAGLAARSPA